MRKICLLITIICLLAASGASAMTLTWSEVLDESYGATVGAHAFAERLRELSRGTMEIDLYTNGTLGFEGESMQGLQWGTLDVFRGNASSLSDYGAPVIATTGLPYLFRNMAEFEEMAESPLGEELLESVEASDCGYVAIAWLVEGPRCLFITETTYESLGSPETFSLDMMRDLDIRVPGTEIINKTVLALGANPIEINFSELHQSLQSGVIDGAENGVIPYVSQKYYEGAPVFIEDAHIFGCGVVLVSAVTWEMLTDEQKAWMREAGRAASRACYEHNLKEQQRFYDQFDALGIRHLQVSDLDRWQAACESVYESLDEPEQAVIRRIQSHDY